MISQLQQKQCNDGNNQHRAETAQQHNHVDYNRNSAMMAATGTGLKQHNTTIMSITTARAH